MRIVLVHPAGSNWMPGKKDVSATANRMAPLGLLSMAAYLEREGHTVFVHDCLGPKASPKPDVNVDAILKQQPDLVGFSATTSGFPDAYAMACRIKKQAPGVEIIFGGVHISALGARLLEDFAQIDYLCMNEGEQTLAKLANGTNPGQIPGLIWRENNRVVENPGQAFLPDLDTLPFPAYEKLAGFPKGYNLPLFSYIKAPGATMVTSRGCPYQCSYCDRSVFKSQFRYNSAEYIYEHMRYMRTRFGIRHLNIYDDLFTLRRGRIARLCDLLASRPLGMQFNCAVRVGHTDDELLEMLKAAGCLMVSLGIETGDPDLLEVHKPGVYLDAVKETVRRIQAAGLRAKGLFMMGLPGESVESIRKTSDFVMSLGLDDMNMAKFTPFHGAPVWKTISGQGAMEEDWRKMNCLNFVFVPSEIGSRQVLDRLYNEHVKRFYSDPCWRKKFTRRLWQHRHSMWRMARHLPDMLSAMRSFENPPGEKKPA
ncbi:magnesium-protoporphyrin IX monomethyl ester (oxidative) cyclase [Desulfosalsimonas propionicica]|uniref:Magnesium-protoporphyrin IX monomethyl ester (Oxidative) cyclase n=1 Tax=Desulfosalsimonas propionicica TaxID=332175 RepID=A0A7W0C8Q2_9BACT|nr:radical SAM protein [Desulfosalsimonas propionicica]MBA2881212.1 magnesium-protoporphyrin IX monomethyl ester (oxidative) cyclase [Desulfosalsimonas propionicica]